MGPASSSTPYCHRARCDSRRGRASSCIEAARWRCSRPGEATRSIVSPRIVRGVPCDVLGGFYPYAGVTQKSRDGAKAIAADALSWPSKRDAAGAARGPATARTRSRSSPRSRPTCPFPPGTKRWPASTAVTACASARPVRVCPPLIVPVREPPPDECKEAFELFQRHVVAWSATGL